MSIFSQTDMFIGQMHDGPQWKYFATIEREVRFGSNFVPFFSLLEENGARVLGNLLIVEGQFCVETNDLVLHMVMMMKVKDLKI